MKDADFVLSTDGEDISSGDVASPRVLRRAAREAYRRGLQQETLSALIPEPPEKGVCLHVVSNGKFDYFRFVSLILSWLEPDGASELYGSTWTLSRSNATDLLGLIDAGKIRRCSIVTGLYFLRRESDVAALLAGGLSERGQRFKAFENHTKLLLISNPARGAFWTVEGSANWTANPRTEQNILLNDEGLYNFHKTWLEEMFAKRR